MPMSRNVLHWWAIVALTAAAGVVVAKAGASATGNIEAIVKAGDGAVLPGVTVMATGTAQRCVTNALGRCLLSKLATGKHTVQASLPGYLTARVPATVAPGNPAPASLVLERAAVPGG